MPKCHNFEDGKRNKYMPMINPLPWSSTLWFEKDWTVFPKLKPSSGWQVLTMNRVFYFSYFSRSTIKRWKDLFTVWRAAARRWRCKRQTALRRLVSCLPFLNPFVNFIEKYILTRVCCSVFVDFGCVACSWAPPQVRGPSGERSPEQRFFHWDYVSMFFVFLFFVTQKIKSSIVIQKVSFA